MIDNAMHHLLCEAADQAGWDEESMMLYATRFLCRLAADDLDVEPRFRAFLHEQVVAGALDGVESDLPAHTQPRTLVARRCRWD